ncbi:hypothetical protein [Nocardiopsis composta]|uniref:Uncharacterized protein n=1 Tax=Nocardiopsis composta TaxID=157465 RepID=A0A7W8VCW6_9ACTN|nr:hypothetical protein [Nocardiopsis composta]MBB5431378.1 hypothetical protein [Nocardiopsis composta]
MSTVNAMTADLDGIRARAAAATPGPWGAEVEGTRLMVLDRGAGLPVAFIGSAEDDQAQADAAFIAAARGDVDALLAVIDHLRAKHAEVQDLSMRRGEEIMRLRGELRAAR